MKERWYHKVFEFIKESTPIIMAASTFFIAIATVRGCKIDQQVADLSNRLAFINERSLNIEKQTANFSKMALQTELRPYITIALLAEAHYKRPFIKTWIFLKNIGKTTAMNIESKYSSYKISAEGEVTPIQEDVIIESKVKSDHLLPGGEVQHKPDINVSGIEGKNINRVKIVFKVAYRGYSEIDKRTYFSKLILLFRKKKTNSHFNLVLEEDKIEYGFE